MSAALVLVGGSGPPAGRQPAMPASAARATLADQMDSAGVPGAAVVVVDAGGATAAHGLGSTRDGREVSAQTPFVIGSTAKSFTVLAAMQLVDTGLVDLDAPVRRYVPELRLANGAAADAITVRHILAQTSGLPGRAGGPVLKAATAGTALALSPSCATRAWSAGPAGCGTTPTPTTSWPGSSSSAPPACPTPTMSNGGSSPRWA